MAIENLQIESKASIPPGIVVPWLGGYFGDSSNGSYTSAEDGSVGAANTFLNRYGWAVCDGSAKNDLDSLFFNGVGRYLPNLTDDRFLMGSTGNGSLGGSNTMLDHTHTDTLSATQEQHRHYHDHASATTDSTGNHRHPLSSDLTKPNVILNQYTYGSGSYAMLTTGGSQYYLRTHTAYAGSHSHTLDIPGIYSDYQTPAITIVGSVGTGNAAISTDNRPKYLTCLYIIKIR